MGIRGLMNSAANDNNSPMALTSDKAAKYVGCRSTNQFRREIDQGIWPQPIALRAALKDGEYSN